MIMFFNWIKKQIAMKAAPKEALMSKAIIAYDKLGIGSTLVINHSIAGYKALQVNGNGDVFIGVDHKINS